MGMFASDSLQLEDVARACEAEGRFEFLVVGLPLRLPGGTGSPAGGAAGADAEDDVGPAV